MVWYKISCILAMWPHCHADLAMVYPHRFFQGARKYKYRSVTGVTTPSIRVARVLGLWQWIEYKTL